MSVATDVMPILAALAGGTFFGDTYRAYLQKKKIKLAKESKDVDALQIIANTAASTVEVMLTPLQKRVAEAEAEAASLRNEIRAAREEIFNLRRQVAELQGEMP